MAEREEVAGVDDPHVLVATQRRDVIPQQDRADLVLRVRKRVPVAVQVEPGAERGEPQALDVDRLRRDRLPAASTSVSALWRTSMCRSPGSSDLRNGLSTRPGHFRLCQFGKVMPPSAPSKSSGPSRSRAQSARTTRCVLLRSSTETRSSSSTRTPSRVCQSSMRCGAPSAPTGSVACVQPPRSLGEMTSRYGASIAVSNCRGGLLKVARRRGRATMSGRMRPARPMRLGTLNSWRADGDVARPRGLLHVETGDRGPRPRREDGADAPCVAGELGQARSSLRVRDLHPGRRARDDEPGRVRGGDQASREVEDRARTRNRRAPQAGFRERVDEELEPSERFQHPRRGERDRVSGRELQHEAARLGRTCGDGWDGARSRTVERARRDLGHRWVAGRILARNGSRNQAFVDCPFGNVLVRQTHDQPAGHSRLGPDPRVLAAHELDVVALDGHRDEVGRTDEVDDEVRRRRSRDELERVGQQAPPGRESIPFDGDDTGSRCTTATSHHATPLRVTKTGRVRGAEQCAAATMSACQSTTRPLVVAARSFARMEARFQGARAHRGSGLSGGR